MSSILDIADEERKRRMEDPTEMRTFEVQYYVDEGLITAKFQGNDIGLNDSWLVVIRDPKFVVIAIPIESVSWVRELE